MRKQQRGVTLLVVLIMLVVMTLFAVSSINLSSINLKVVGNLQNQKTMEANAQQAIEALLNSPSAYGLTAAASTTTVNGMTVNLDTPSCLYASPAAGYSAVASVAAITPEDTDWELVARVTDSLTSASAVVHQGVRIRMLAGNCP
ncbi:MAG: hypothetical protein HY017_20980 [Betaproteobacteria bacterium]|nr:hypothetical protein [Betaproteobacteria bacterium]